MDRDDTIRIMGQPYSRSEVELRLRAVVLLVCVANLTVNIIRLTRNK